MRQGVILPNNVEEKKKKPSAEAFKYQPSNHYRPEGNVYGGFQDRNRRSDEARTPTNVTPYNVAPHNNKIAPNRTEHERTSTKAEHYNLDRTLHNGEDPSYVGRNQQNQLDDRSRRQTSRQPSAVEYDSGVCVTPDRKRSRSATRTRGRKEHNAKHRSKSASRTSDHASVASSTSSNASSVCDRSKPRKGIIKVPMRNRCIVQGAPDSVSIHSSLSNDTAHSSISSWSGDSSSLYSAGSGSINSTGSETSNGSMYGMRGQTHLPKHAAPPALRKNRRRSLPKKRVQFCDQIVWISSTEEQGREENIDYKQYVECLINKRPPPTSQYRESEPPQTEAVRRPATPTVSRRLLGDQSYDSDYTSESTSDDLPPPPSPSVLQHQTASVSRRRPSTEYGQIGGMAPNTLCQLCHSKTSMGPMSAYCVNCSAYMANIKTPLSTDA